MERCLMSHVIIRASAKCPPNAPFGVVGLARPVRSFLHVSSHGHGAPSRASRRKFVKFAFRTWTTSGSGRQEQAGCEPIRLTTYYRDSFLSLSLLRTQIGFEM
eukprot:scaffold20206_cov34-Tisochrysis_lutea.AAC.4